MIFLKNSHRTQYFVISYKRRESEKEYICVCVCICMYICIYVYIYVTESLCCTPKTNTTL